MKSIFNVITFINGVLLTGLSFASYANKEAAKKINTRPNIVFIIADDLSWKHLGAYGCNEINTPNIDKLAKEGIIFENAYVSTSSCTPSRASVLTGRNGFELEEGASLWGYLPAKFPTYTEILAANGYRTGATGKGWAPGFLIDRNINPAGMPYNKITSEPYKELFEKIAISNIDYSANFESFLNITNKNQPFCFWLGAFEPHRGYTQGFAASQGKNFENVVVPDFLPNTKEVRDDICEYYAETEHIDKHVGKVEEILKKYNKLENTIIIVTSDNGMPFPRAKASLYDYGTHMPLIVWWGKNIKGGRKVSDMISFTDFAPTFLEIAGIEKPKEMSGTSFLSLLISEKSGLIDSTRQKVYMYRERHGWSYKHGVTFASRAVRTSNFLLIWNAYSDSLLPRDVDGGPTKYFMDEHKNEYPHLFELSFGKREELELYNIKTDPFQLHNLADNPNYSKTLENLKTDLFSYLKERKAPRMLGNPEIFIYTPYFGGLLKWTPEQQRAEFSFDERRELMRKMYSKKDENDFFEEMIKRQKGKL